MLGSETAPFARGSDCRGVCDLHRSADHVRPRLSEEDGTSFRCVSAADLYRFTPSQDGFGPVIVEDQDGPSGRDRSSDHWSRKDRVMRMMRLSDERNDEYDRNDVQAALQDSLTHSLEVQLLAHCG